MEADPIRSGTARGDPGAEPGTVAVVVATTPVASLPCAAGGTLLDRVTEQLAMLPIREVHIVARDIAGGADTGAHGVTVSDGLAEDLRTVAKLARTATSPLAVLPADLLAHTEALALLLGHPARPTGAIVAGGAPGPLPPPVRIEQDRIASAGTSFHRVGQANATFRGVLLVGRDHLAGLAEVAEELADLVAGRNLAGVGDHELPELLLAGLVRVGVPVKAVPIGGLHCTRVGDADEAGRALRELAAVDVDAARLDAAIKSDDGFFTTFCVSSWSRHLVRLAAKAHLTPNTVTGMSVGLAVIAAVWFTGGHRGAMLTGAVALYLSFVLDCVDGQLARYTGRFSALGGWLDAICDRLKEFIVYAGLAIGYPGGGAWPLAIAALLVQVTRHMADFAYAGARADARRDAPRPRRPLTVPWDDAPSGGARGGAAGSVLALAWRFDGGAGYWLKKMIVLPVGERTAVIAVTAGLFDARVTFLTLLGWGLIALAYTVAGRMARSLA